MNFIHCNRCFDRKPPNGFLISSCFHVFCHKCGEKDHTRCPLCKKDVKIVRLDGSISSSIRIYFADTIKTLSDSMTKLQRKIEFQGNIRIHVIKHLSKEKEKKRQIEIYCRKKGEEFESQKKKLSEMNSWIETAERKLRAGEEERLRLQNDYEQLQMKFRSLVAAPPDPFLSQTSSLAVPFSLMDSQDPGRPTTSLTPSSSNSTFNLNSPFANSPAGTNTSSDFRNFFEGDNNNNNNNGDGRGCLSDDVLFNSTSSNHTIAANTSDSSAFSAAFNNMFTPSRNVPPTNQLLIDHTKGDRDRDRDKTSASLEHWRANHSHSFGAHDMTRRETSLPENTTMNLSRFPPNPRNVPVPQYRRNTGGIDRNQLRELRRFSSQPGFLAHRKLYNNRTKFIDQSEN